MKRSKYNIYVGLRIAGLFIAAAFISSCSTTGPGLRPPAEGSYVSMPGHLSLPSPMRQDIYHTVAPGETLWRISQMYGVEIKTIKKINRIMDVRDLEIGERLFIPAAAPRIDIVSLYPGRKWKYIIIHHSATDHGNSENFNRAHLNRGWKGVGYHFVIDNGTCGKGDGQIETTPRWIKQEDGAHCKADGMNEKGIGICLVGNFSIDRVSPAQMKSLVYLVKQLKDYYNIPLSRILGHGQVPGARTECPGKKFPWKAFYSNLRRQD